MNSKKKKILLAITMITLWIITAESTTVSTRPNNEPATPAALPTQEPPSQKPTTTTTSNPPLPTTTTPRPRQIPQTINEEPTRTTTMTTTTVEQDIKALICSYSWPCHEALQVAECESNFKPHAISPPNRNGTRDYGLMQINNGAWGKRVFGARWDNVLDAKINLDMAWHIYQTAGSWQPWTCRP